MVITAYFCKGDYDMLLLLNLWMMWCVNIWVYLNHYELSMSTCQYVCAFSAGAAPDSDGTVVRCTRKQLTIRGENTWFHWTCMFISEQIIKYKLNVLIDAIPTLHHWMDSLLLVYIFCSIVNVVYSILTLKLFFNIFHFPQVNQTHVDTLNKNSMSH